MPVLTHRDLFEEEYFNSLPVQDKLDTIEGLSISVFNNPELPPDDDSLIETIVTEEARAKARVLGVREDIVGSAFHPLADVKRSAIPFNGATVSIDRSNGVERFRSDRESFQDVSQLKPLSSDATEEEVIAHVEQETGKLSKELTDLTDEEKELIRIGAGASDAERDLLIKIEEERQAKLNSLQYKDFINEGMDPDGFRMPSGPVQIRKKIPHPEDNTYQVAVGVGGEEDNFEIELEPGNIENLKNELITRSKNYSRAQRKSIERVLGSPGGIFDTTVSNIIKAGAGTFSGLAGFAEGFTGDTAVTDAIQGGVSLLESDLPASQLERRDDLLGAAVTGSQTIVKAVTQLSMAFATGGVAAGGARAAGLGQAGQRVAFAGTVAGQQTLSEIGHIQEEAFKEHGDRDKARRESLIAGSGILALEFVAGAVFADLADASRAMSKVKKSLIGAGIETSTEIPQEFVSLAAEAGIRETDAIQEEFTRVGRAFKGDVKAFKESRLIQAGIGAAGAGGIVGATLGGQAKAEEDVTTPASKDIKKTTLTIVDKINQQAAKAKEEAKKAPATTEAPVIEAAQERTFPEGETGTKAKALLQFEEQFTEDAFKVSEKQDTKGKKFNTAKSNFRRRQATKAKIEQAVDTLNNPDATEQQKTEAQNFIDSRFKKANQSQLVKDGRVSKKVEDFLETQEQNENESQEQRTSSEQADSGLPGGKLVKRPSSDQELGSTAEEGSQNAIHEIEEGRVQSPPSDIEKAFEMSEGAREPSIVDAELQLTEQRLETEEDPDIREGLLNKQSELVLELNAAEARESARAVPDQILSDIESLHNQIADNNLRSEEGSVTPQESQKANTRLLNRIDTLSRQLQQATEEIKVGEATQIAENFAASVASQLPDYTPGELEIVIPELEEAVRQSLPRRLQGPTQAPNVQQVVNEVSKTLKQRLGNLWEGIKDKIYGIVVKLLNKIGAIHFAVDPNEGTSQETESEGIEATEEVIARAEEVVSENEVKISNPIDINDNILPDIRTEEEIAFSSRVLTGLVRLLPSRKFFKNVVSTVSFGSESVGNLVGDKFLGGISARIGGERKNIMMDQESTEINDLAFSLRRFVPAVRESVHRAVKEAAPFGHETDLFGRILDFRKGIAIAPADLVEQWTKQGKGNTVTLQGQEIQLTEEEQDGLIFWRTLYDHAMALSEKHGVTSDEFDKIQKKTGVNQKEFYATRGSRTTLMFKDTQTGVWTPVPAKFRQQVAQHVLKTKKAFQKERFFDTQENGMYFQDKDGNEYGYGYQNQIDAYADHVASIHAAAYVKRFNEKGTQIGDTKFHNKNDFYDAAKDPKIVGRVGGTPLFLGRLLTTDMAVRTARNIFGTVATGETAKLFENIAGASKQFTATADDSVHGIQLLPLYAALFTRGTYGAVKGVFGLDKQKMAARGRMVSFPFRNLALTLAEFFKSDTIDKRISSPENREAVEKLNILGITIGESVNSDENQAFFREGIGTKILNAARRKSLAHPGRIAAESTIGILERFSNSFKAGITNSLIEMAKINIASNGELFSDDDISFVGKKIMGISDSLDFGLSQNQRVFEAIMLHSAMLTRTGVDIVAASLNPRDPLFKKVNEIIVPAFIALGTSTIAIQALLKELGLSDDDEDDALIRSHPFSLQAFRITYKDELGNTHSLSLGGGYVGLFRRLGQASASVVAGAEEGEVKEGIADATDQMGRWLRMKMNSAASLAASELIFDGTTVMGEVIPDDFKGKMDFYARHGAVPFALQDYVNRGEFHTSPASRKTNFLLNHYGVNSYVVNPSSIESKEYEQALKQAGFDEKTASPIIKAQYQSQFRLQDPSRENIVKAEGKNETVIFEESIEKGISTTQFVQREAAKIKRFYQESLPEWMRRELTGTGGIDAQYPSFRVDQKVRLPGNTVVPYRMDKYDVERLKLKQREELVPLLTDYMQRDSWRNATKETKLKIYHRLTKRATDRARRSLGYLVPR